VGARRKGDYVKYSLIKGQGFQCIGYRQGSIALKLTHPI